MENLDGPIFAVAIIVVLACVAYLWATRDTEKAENRICPFCGLFMTSTYREFVDHLDNAHADIIPPDPRKK